MEIEMRSELQIGDAALARVLQEGLDRLAEIRQTLEVLNQDDQRLRFLWKAQTQNGTETQKDRSDAKGAKLDNAAKFVTKVTHVLAKTFGRALNCSPKEILEAVAKLEYAPTPMFDSAADVAAALAISEVPAVLPSWGCIEVPQISAFLYDWDDNILNMRSSNVYLFHKETGQQLTIPTDLYATVRKHGVTYNPQDPIEEQPGKNRLDGDLSGIQLHEGDLDSINWSCFTHRAQDPLHGTYRDYRDVADPYILDKTTEQALKNEDFGPMWDDFVFKCSNPITAQFTYIITARGHSPESFHRVLKKMQQDGRIKYVPPLENMLPVIHRTVTDRLGVEYDESKTSEIKLAAISQIMERIQATPLGKTALGVLDKDGILKAPMHTVVFSDDDPVNEKMVQNGIGALLRQDPSRFDKVKFTTFGTGKSERRMKVLQSDGTLRDVHPQEQSETWQIHANNQMAVLLAA